MHIIFFLFLLHPILNTNLCESFAYQNVYFNFNAGETKDRNQTIQFQNDTAVLNYNLCNDISKVCSIKTQLQDGTIQVVDYTGPAMLAFSGKCIPFTTLTGSGLQNQSSLSSSYIVNFSSPSIPNESNISTTYNLVLVNPCITSMTNQALPNNTFIIISNLQGCPILDLTTIWSYFDNHKFAFFLTTLIFGVIMMLLGLYMYRITIWLVGGLAGFGILLLIESVTVFLPGVPNNLINSIVIITGITSIFIGYVTLYFPKFGTFGLGAWIGVILSFILNNIALYRIKSSISTLPLLITLAILAIAFGILALFFKKSFIIISTSFIGAYCSIRALSWYLGAFPNQFLIAKQVQYESVKVQWQYYIYVVALFILTGSSMAIQFWLFRKRAKLLGKSTNIDEYVNQINNQIDQERSKYLVFQNVFKKKKKGKVEPRYLERKNKGSNSESNYSSERKSSSEEENSEQEEQSEQEMKEIPKKVVKFQRADFGNKNKGFGKNQQRNNLKKAVESSESSRSSKDSRDHDESQQSEQQSQRNYKNAKRKQSQSKKSLKQKLIQKQPNRRH